MLYRSITGSGDAVSLREALILGLAPDGGLFMPQFIPTISKEDLLKLRDASFQEICFQVLRLFLESDIESGILKEMVIQAMNFDLPIRQISKDLSFLELFHGPIFAFKDFGARFMAQLLRHSSKEDKNVRTVLVATSGDTGSAVAHGFSSVPGVRVVILYPAGKISDVQEAQLTTLGGNIHAVKVEGTFDDCQRLVKVAFLDPLLKGVNLTSANSINIGRLLPQICYYFYGYLRSKSDNLIFSVPSGNLGNLTGGLIAKRMGLPIKKFISASNANSVFPEFLSTSRFVPRPSVRTISNAMDVGNPSNIGRILWLYSNNIEAIRDDIRGEVVDEDLCRSTITKLYRNYSYIADPHSAVAAAAWDSSKEELNGDCIILSTAHPGKFAEVVEESIGQSIAIPEPLLSALGKKRYSIGIKPDDKALRNLLLKL